MWYAVGRGAAPGVYSDWDAAKRQVTGVSGGVVRKFADRDAAAAFVRLCNLPTPCKLTIQSSPAQVVATTASGDPVAVLPGQRQRSDAERSAIQHCMRYSPVGLQFVVDTPYLLREAKAKGWACTPSRRAVQIMAAKSNSKTHL